MDWTGGKKASDHITRVNGNGEFFGPKRNSGFIIIDKGVKEQDDEISKNVHGLMHT